MKNNKRGVLNKLVGWEIFEKLIRDGYAYNANKKGGSVLFQKSDFPNFSFGFSDFISILIGLSDSYLLAVSNFDEKCWSYFGNLAKIGQLYRFYIFVSSKYVTDFRADFRTFRNFSSDFWTLLPSCPLHRSSKLKCLLEVPL